MTKTIAEINELDWIQAGVNRYGADKMKWRFACPSCGHIATPQDWKDVGAKEGEVAFSCVGRHMDNPATVFAKPGPCNYAGGGLFGLNPVTVVGHSSRHRLFDFADDPLAASEGL